MKTLSLNLSNWGELLRSVNPQALCVAVWQQTGALQVRSHTDPSGVECTCHAA